jgi:hypothetical protein
MLLKDPLEDFEMVPVAPIITGVTFVFTFRLLLLLLRIIISSSSISISALQKNLTL